MLTNRVYSKTHQPAGAAYTHTNTQFTYQLVDTGNAAGKLLESYKPVVTARLCVKQQNNDRSVHLSATRSVYVHNLLTNETQLKQKL